MKKLMILLPLFLCLNACNKVEPVKYYASFMSNFPRVTYDSPSGNPVKVDNLLFEKVEISPNTPFNKPDTDPKRPNYKFDGWYKESECKNAWDFENDSSKGNIFLYAKWDIAGKDEYEEPEYVYPEVLIDAKVYRVTGILNVPLNEDGSVNLTKGGINRLVNSPNDVSFAINYQRNKDITLVSATYDVDEKVINVKSSDNNEVNILVHDVTLNYSIEKISKTYESKAQKYEEQGKEYENYHIMLAGSSSMELWANSTQDMSPIVSYNTGIGGTTVQQWSEKLLYRLVLPYSPKAVVYYVGVNNIINSNQSGQTTGEAVLNLFNQTHLYLPNTQIFYVLINKLPGYLRYQDQFDITNNMAIEFSNSHSWVKCINAGKDLLKESGDPHAAYFRTDGLHMSEYGYIIWGANIKQAIIDWLG